MKYTTLFLAAIGGLMTAACSNDSDINNGQTASEQQERVEIRLGSSLNAVTRAAYTTTQSDKLAAGQKVYVWIDDHGNGTTSASAYINAWALTSGADATVTGLTNPVVLNSDNSYKFYYPNTGNNIDIYAVHGNLLTTDATPVEIMTCTQDAPLTGATAFPTTLTHTIKPNQTGVSMTSEAYTDGYEASDLLVAKNTNCAKSATSHNLPFQHLLSKIEVYLFAGNGVTKSDLQDADASLTLLNTKLQGTLTLTKAYATIGSVAPATGSTTGTIYMKLQAQDDQAPTDYTAPTGITSDGNAYRFGEAIIIPQQFDTVGDGSGSAQNFISFNFKGGGSLVAKVKQDFLSGKRYIYYITVNRTGLTLTATLTDWTAGTISPTTGTAE